MYSKFKDPLEDPDDLPGTTEKLANILRDNVYDLFRAGLGAVFVFCAVIAAVTHSPGFATLAHLLGLAHIAVSWLTVLDLGKDLDLIRAVGVTILYIVVGLGVSAYLAFGG